MATKKRLSKLLLIFLNFEEKIKSVQEKMVDL